MPFRYMGEQESGRIGNTFLTLVLDGDEQLLQSPLPALSPEKNPCTH